MPYFLEVPLSSGEVVLAEVTEPVDDVVPFGGGKDVVGRLTGSFGGELGRVRDFAAEVLTSMKGAGERPDRVAIEFELGFSVKAGVVVAQASGDGHVRVTLEWTKPAHNIGPGSEPAAAEPGDA